MTSLSSKQNQTGPKMSLISSSRLPTHLQDYHQHRCLQQHIPGHPMIYPVINTSQDSKDGAVGGVDTNSEQCSKLKIEVQPSIPDYDNLVPPARLDPIVEDVKGGDKLSINSLRYANSATNNIHDVTCMEKMKTVRGGAGDDSGAGFHSSKKYKTGDDHSNCRSSDSKTSVCENVDEKVTVKETEMGNNLVSAPAECMSNATAVRDISKCEDDVREIVSTRQKMCSDLDNNINTTCSINDKQNIEENLKDSSDLRSILCERTERKTKMRDEIEGKHHNSIVISSTGRSASSSTATKTTKRKLVSFTLSDPDSSTNRKERTSEIELSCTRRTFPATSESKKASHGNQTTFKMEKSTSFDDSDRRLQHSQNRQNIYSGKKTSNGQKTSMATARGPHVFPVQTPVIVITPSTPKIRSSKSSTYKKISNFQGSKQTIHHTHSSKIVEKKDKIPETEMDKSQAESKDYKVASTANKNITVCDRKDDELTSRSVVLEDIRVVPSAGKCNSDNYKIEDNVAALANALSKRDKRTVHIDSGPPGTCTTDLVKSINVVKEDMNPQTDAGVVSNTSTKSWTSPTEIFDKRVDSTMKNTSSEVNCGDYAEPSDTIKNASVAQIQEANLTEVTVEISHYSVIVSDNNAANKMTPKVHEDSSLTSDDVDSLLESHYTVIPESSKESVSTGSKKLTSDDNHHRVNLPGDATPLSNAKIDGTNEAIYAIPIPKSQRKKHVSQQSKGSKRELPVNSKLHRFAETELPPTPPRHPVSTTALPQFTSDDGVCTNSVEVTCQIKKSTTADMLHSVPDVYDYANVPKYGRYDFFSLGRQPRHFRTNPLTSSKGMAVSLEMLLRFRRQSLSDLTSTANTDQALSVEDIIQSCSEFEKRNVFYRGRTSSDSTQNSSLYSLPFFGVNSNRFYDWRVKEKANHLTEDPFSFKPSQKANNRDRPETRRDIKINQDHALSRAILERKMNAVSEIKTSIQSTCGVSKKDTWGGRLNGSVKDVKVSTVTSSETNFYSGDDKQRALQESQPGIPEIDKSDHLNAISNADDTRTMEFFQPCSKSDFIEETQSHKIITNKVNICSPVTKEKSKTQDGLVRHDSEYDTLEDSHNSHIIPEATPYPSEMSKGYPSAAEDHIPSVKDANALSRPPTAVSDSAALIFLPIVQEADKQKAAETVNSTADVESTEVSFTKEGSKTESIVQTTSSVLSVPDETIKSSSEIRQHSIPSLQTDSHTSENVTSNLDIAMSSSILSSPLSPISVWSDDSSLGVISPLSEDVFTDISLEELPTQKTPNYFSQLEAEEALKWLRAAGFPQYAQMFEDGQSPLDMRVIERDHDFLDQDSLQSLFRRLEKLNKYAGISLDVLPGKKGTSEEDDDEDPCALSDRWEYKKSVRRWSRKDASAALRQTTDMGSDQKDAAVYSSSQDSLLDQIIFEDSPSSISKKPRKIELQPQNWNEVKTLPSEKLRGLEIPQRNEDLKGVPISPNLNHTSSQKSKSSKNFFGKVEVLKSKKSRRESKRRKILEISGPIIADNEYMRAKLERLNCVDISPTSDTILNQHPIGERPQDKSCTSSSVRHRGRHSSHGDSVSAISSRSPLSSTPVKSSPDAFSRPRESLPSALTLKAAHEIPGSDYTSLISCSPVSPNSSFHEDSQYGIRQRLNMHTEQGHEAVKKTNSDISLMEVFMLPQNHKPGRFPEELQNGYIEAGSDGTVFIASSGSVARKEASLMPDHKASSMSTYSSKAPRMDHRVSMYDNILPGSRNTGEAAKPRMIFPGIYEVGVDRNIPCTDQSEELVRPGGHGSVDVSTYELSPNTTSKYNTCAGANISVDSALVSPTDTTFEQMLRSSDHERNVSFETSSSSQTPAQSTQGSEAGISSSDDRSSRSSTDSYPPKPRIMCHSSSLDSCFRDSSSRNADSTIDSSESKCRQTLRREFEDFDHILQQLYQNINDLSDYMGKDKQADPRSSHGTTDSMRFYGVFGLDQENSFSGGEGSNTAESSSEDPEMVVTDLSHDESLDHIPVSRERRDSGVGHSLPRASSERRRKKIRWNSFQKSHRPDINSRAMQINSLTACQMVRLQKLCLLKLTGIMEKCLPISRSGWNWILPRFMKRQKTLGFIDKKVFGVSLSAMAQRTGQPLPQSILYAMRYLRHACPTAVGIFRKSGVKSKIQQLRDELEAHPDAVDFEGVNAYNVADMLKTYFRDLPECLLTNKMSEIFRSIYMHVPESQRLEAIQTAIVLLPDENREVLQSMLLFLSDISTHEADHQMNASNLAVCFTPTVFQLGPRQMTPQSPRRNHKTAPAIPDPREIMEQKAAHECLLLMITECKKLFTILPSLYQQLHVQFLAQLMPEPLQSIDCSPAEVRAFGQERIQIVLKEAHDRNRGWLPTMTVGDIEVFHRKPLDACPLREWKLTVDVEAPPVEVLHRIMHERHVWDEDLISWSVVKRPDVHSDMFQFVLNSMAPHPSRHFCVLRYWRSDLNKGACALVTMSVEPAAAIEVQGLWAMDLGSYFLMEPCGSGRSRLTYITRVDTRGRTPEWYTRIFGHVCTNFLERLRESFRHFTSGPETRV